MSERRIKSGANRRELMMSTAASELTLDDIDDRDPVEALAAEYAERYRRGERVTIDEYVRCHPEHAKQIQELFPAVVAMERLHAKHLRDGVETKELLQVDQLGDYRILSEIARGGMGVIYEAEQVTLGRRVAIKILPPRALRGLRDIQRFQREAQTASRLHHTNIVPVFGTGYHDGHHYIVMQLIRGVGLDEIISDLRRMVSDIGSSSASHSDDHRSTTVRRSAVGLLEETLVQGSASTTRIVHGGAIGASSPRRVPEASGAAAATDLVAAGKIHALVGSEYYRNVARIGLQAAQALGYAHQHEILHRDVKPGNLLLDDEGVVWMADFGLAKGMTEGSVTCTGDIVGTLGYMAPERFEGVATAHSDIYSLGLTLHELLTFDRAFDGTDRVSIMHQVTTKGLVKPRTRNPDVPRDLETIVLKATSRMPHDRYSNANEMACDLQSFLEDRPIAARRMNYLELLFRSCRRNKVVATLAASVLLLLSALGAMLASGYLHAKSQHKRAEETSKLAVAALDKIYGQFAPGRVTFPSSTTVDVDEAEASIDAGQVPISKDVALLLESLLRFYDDLSHQTNDSEGVAVKSIAANRRVADIRRRLGEFEKARVTYQQTIERFAGLPADVRERTELRTEFARIQNGLGIVLGELDLHREALAAHQQAIAQFDQGDLAATERFELARSLYLAHLTAQRAPEESDDSGVPSNAVDRAIEILSRLQVQNPEISEYPFLLARCWLSCDSHSDREGGLSEEQKKGLSILEGLVAQSPEVADYRYELGEAYRAIEFNEFRRQRREKRCHEELAKSEARLLKALEFTDGLDATNPNIPQYVALNKRLHYLLATVYQDQNRLEEAANQFELSSHKQRLLVQQAYNPLREKVWLHHIELEQAQVWRDLKQHRKARESLESIVVGLEGLLTAPSGQLDRETQRNAEKFLSKSYVTLGCILNRLGESEAAEEALRKAERPGG